MSDHLSDLRLDALRIDPASASPEVLTHLEACGSCQARRALLDQEAAAFSARFDLPGLAAEVLGRQRAPRWWQRTWSLGGAAAALGLVLILILIPRPELLRVKGDAPLFEVFLVRGESKLSLEGPVPARAALAVRVSPRARAEVRVYWKTPSAWAPLYPAKDAPSWMVTAPTWLERAVVLDDELAPEVLGVIACQAELGDAEAQAMLADELPLRPDCERRLQVIEKQRPGGAP
ncbi:MAG: hypothetical protein U1E65_15860 [Myxococcota bacterium]